jgi:hypothetical protein
MAYRIWWRTGLKVAPLCLGTGGQRIAGISSEWIERFAEGVQKIPEVIELHRMGDVDYLLRIRNILPISAASLNPCFQSFSPLQRPKTPWNRRRHRDLASVSWWWSLSQVGIVLETGVPVFEGFKKRGGADACAAHSIGSCPEEGMLRCIRKGVSVKRRSGPFRSSGQPQILF